MKALASREGGATVSVKYGLVMGCTCIILLLFMRKNLYMGVQVDYPEASEIQRVPKVGGPLKFVQYRPSKIEQEWYEKRWVYERTPSEICKDLGYHTEKMRSWISFLDHGDHDNGDDFDSDVFSQLVFEDKNGNEHRKIIEPLIGHFRHPFALPNCKPEGNAVRTQDRSYIAFGGASRVDDSFYPGKRYLFDLGTAAFWTSLQYFISRYSGLGIEFDSIWAWEAERMPNYWDYVPHDVQGKLHFYNQAISSDLTSPSHPLKILKTVYQPGDFVVRWTAVIVGLYAYCQLILLQLYTSSFLVQVLKLDIDNTPLEMSIMDEVERDDALRNMISDFMFELHYNSADMQVHFGSPNMSYAEALMTLRRFRELGVPLHYWP